MLTELQKQHGPFASAAPAGWPVPVVITGDGGDRVRLVRESTDPEWLRAVIKDRDVQTSVRLAAERRLRKLGRAGSPLPAAARSGVRALPTED